MLSSPGGTNVFTSTPHVAYSDQEEKTMVEKIAEEKQSSSYKLIDLLKFVCAFLVIGIHTRPFQASSELLDKVFYYDMPAHLFLTKFTMNEFSSLGLGSAVRHNLLNERKSKTWPFP